MLCRYEYHVDDGLVRQAVILNVGRRELDDMHRSCLSNTTLLIRLKGPLSAHLAIRPAVSYMVDAFSGYSMLSVNM